MNSRHRSECPAPGTLGLSAHDVLTTTRAVRRRLDLERPVDPALLLDCTRTAQQAPSGRNRQRWDFLFVTDPAQRARLAQLWRRGLRTPVGRDDTAPSRNDFAGTSWRATTRGVDSLAENLHRVPVLLVPTITIGTRSELDDPVIQAGTWGSVLPAIWSFMLAARNHGLGTVWTTSHLNYERDAADLLKLPYETTLQCALIPVAHTIGDRFQPGTRVDTEQIIHWDHW